ncbi:MAG: hypothetical protein ABL901_02765 [Hyphomicrobiaceae bacterium]|nr:hypothetical protein [Hyphomicrobiaceae bacterium]
MDADLESVTASAQIVSEAVKGKYITADIYGDGTTEVFKVIGVDVINGRLMVRLESEDCVAFENCTLAQKFFTAKGAAQKQCEIENAEIGENE